MWRQAGAAVDPAFVRNGEQGRPLAFQDAVGGLFELPPSMPFDLFRQRLAVCSSRLADALALEHELEPINSAAFVETHRPCSLFSPCPYFADLPRLWYHSRCNRQLLQRAEQHIESLRF